MACLVAPPGSVSTKQLDSIGDSAVVLRFRCDCGQTLQVLDPRAARQVACPACQAVIVLADPQAGKPPAPPPAAPPPVEPPPRETAPIIPAAADNWEVVPVQQNELVEVTPEREPEARPRKKQRKKAQARRRGLEKLSLALVIDLGGTLVFLPAMWTGWLGLALLLISWLPDASGAANPAKLFQILSGFGLAVTALIEIPATLLCLNLPDAGARGILAGSLACRSAGLVFAILSLFLTGLREVLLLLAFGLTIGGWVLWMCFLAWVGRYLDRREFTTEALHAVVSGLITLVATLLLLLMAAGMVMLIVWIKIWIARSMLSVISLTVFLACVRISVALGRSDTVLESLLTPTGIPFVFNRQLPLVSSLRAVIERRT